jgi:hypothetical protein
MRQESAAGMGVQGILMADARKQQESPAGVDLQGMTATDEGVRCAARVDTALSSRFGLQQQHMQRVRKHL